MLLERITNFCKDEYEYYSSKDSCLKCKNLDWSSEKYDICKKCLEDVHFQAINEKMNYDCINMINYYTCCYSFKYTSEILYLMKESTCLKRLNTYNIVSFGCGPCTDLMAFEKYNKRSNKQIKYIGIDNNVLWKAIHKKIIDYTDNTAIKAHFIYKDALDIFSAKKCKGVNVIVLQYFISSLYNNGQINEIDNFFDLLINNIISYKSNDEPFVIMINDVNSNNRGRDYFLDLFKKLEQAGFNCDCNKFYFETEYINEYQRYGNMHSCNSILFDIHDNFSEYHAWKNCTSAQLLIEIK